MKKKVLKKLKTSWSFNSKVALSDDEENDDNKSGIELPGQLKISIVLALKKTYYYFLNFLL